MKRCNTTREFSTQAVDPTKAGNDTSWLKGQHSSSSLTVPTAPTLKEKDRYLARLCGAWVPSGARLVGARQGANIVAQSDSDPGDEWPSFAFCDITYSRWVFPNGVGNLLWGITAIPQHVVDRANASIEATAGRSQSPYRTDSAFLFVAGQGDRPPGGGAFVGDDVGGYGVFSDLKFGSKESYRPMSVYFKEKSLVLFQCSVKQPPLSASWPTPVAGFSTAGMMNEDVFVNAHLAFNPRYGQLWGSIIIDFEECCDTCCPTCGKTECNHEENWGTFKPMSLLEIP